MSDLVEMMLEKNGRRLDSSQRELANALRRISELERHLETEAEIVHDIACEAESAQAGEAAALERVAELEMVPAPTIDVRKCRWQNDCEAEE